MNKSMKAMLKSYVRGFVTAITPLVIIGEIDWQTLVLAGLAAVIPPAIRALDKNDPSFGLVANTVENAIITVASKSKKKTK